MPPFQICRSSKRPLSRKNWTTMTGTSSVNTPMVWHANIRGSSNLTTISHTQNCSSSTIGCQVAQKVVSRECNVRQASPFLKIWGISRFLPRTTNRSSLDGCTSLTWLCCHMCSSRIDPIIELRAVKSFNSSLTTVSMESLESSHNLSTTNSHRWGPKQTGQNCPKNETISIKLKEVISVQSRWFWSEL